MGGVAVDLDDQEVIGPQGVDLERTKADVGVGARETGAYEDTQERALGL